MLTVFHDSFNYILTLKIQDKSIVTHEHKTGFIGFLINIKSIYHLASDLLTMPKNPLKFFLSYKCSQDHLELTFSCIRSRGGWNDNPNALQFRWTLR